MNKKVLLGMIVYIVPSFPLAYAWHLTTFAAEYATLDLLRADPVLPMGLASMILQGAFYSWAYPRLFNTGRSMWLNSAVRATVVFGLLAWTYAVLAVAAKTQMHSVRQFLVLESGWTLLQFSVTMPLLALVWRKAE
jgi:hypothetical protein